jgi:hypothetical protein
LQHVRHLLLRQLQEIKQALPIIHKATQPEIPKRNLRLQITQETHPPTAIPQTARETRLPAAILQMATLLRVVPTAVIILLRETADRRASRTVYPLQPAHTP